MKQNRFFITIVIAILLFGSACSRFRRNPELIDSSVENKPSTAEETTTFRSDREAAIAKAKKLYQEKATQKMDFSSGPCLSNEIINDWVVDIAHNPRQTIDEKPENQCATYRNKQVRHFVELDPDGNVIRAL